MAAKGERFVEPNLAINRVYTRKGDTGQTQLVGGQTTVDELTSLLGQARVSCLEARLDEIAAELLRVQHALFNLGTILATLPSDLTAAMPQVTETDIEWLEEMIDKHNAALPALRSFVLPGGCRANAELHVARTVCRRAERICVEAAQVDDIAPIVLQYLNRLSDALFVWSRAVSVQQGEAEVLWDPNKA